jgi:hypothetical protein
MDEVFGLLGSEEEFVKDLMKCFPIEAQSILDSFIDSDKEISEDLFDEFMTWFESYFDEDNEALLEIAYLDPYGIFIQELISYRTKFGLVYAV